MPESADLLRRVSEAFNTRDIGDSHVEPDAFTREPDGGVVADVRQLEAI